jgi:hypothetical protein
MENIGGIAWSFAVVGGPIILGIAIGYGIIKWRDRAQDPATKRESDIATREGYHAKADTP